MQFALKLLINRDYAFLWARRTVSNLSDWVFVTSVTLWIATGIAGGQSWAPLAVGGAGIAVAVLTVSIGPLAGVFVDRWDKRRMMIAADLIRFGLMAALILVPTVGTQLPTAIRLGTIYTVIVLATVCSTFFGPDTLYGFVAASVAVGALAGAALMAMLASRIDPPRLFSGSVIALGLAIVVYSRMTALVPALLVALLVGFPEVAVNIAVTPILLAAAPAELVGGVSATLMPTSSLAQIGSVALSGYLASTLLRDLHAQALGVQVRTYDAIFGVAGLLFVASGVYATAGMRRRSVAPSAEAALQPP